MLAFLTDAERLLVAETELANLRSLDEDGLLALHDRVRRQRTKYQGNYRRQASAQVPAQGGRGFSYAKNTQARAKAEVFEIALYRVSRQVGLAAQRSADELRAERLEAAQIARAGSPPPVPAASGRSAGAQRVPAARKTTGDLKRDKSSQAQGARRQAKRDSRS